jgi:hypothetical protein
MKLRIQLWHLVVMVAFAAVLCTYLITNAPPRPGPPTILGVAAPDLTGVKR